MPAITVQHSPRTRYVQQGDRSPTHEIVINPAELAALLPPGGSGIASNPPSGCYRVTNIYIQNGKLVAKWDDTPIP
jgi:hypothetical protein